MDRVRARLPELAAKAAVSQGIESAPTWAYQDGDAPEIAQRIERLHKDNLKAEKAARRAEKQQLRQQQAAAELGGDAEPPREKGRKSKQLAADAAPSPKQRKQKKARA